MMSGLRWGSHLPSPTAQAAPGNLINTVTLGHTHLTLQHTPDWRSREPRAAREPAGLRGRWRWRWRRLLQPGPVPCLVTTWNNWDWILVVPLLLPLCAVQCHIPLQRTRNSNPPGFLLCPRHRRLPESPSMWQLLMTPQCHVPLPGHLLPPCPSLAAPAATGAAFWGQGECPQGECPQGVSPRWEHGGAAGPNGPLGQLLSLPSDITSALATAALGCPCPGHLSPGLSLSLSQPSPPCPCPCLPCPCPVPVPGA